MINFKINGYDVSCDSAEDAAKLLFHKDGRKISKASLPAMLNIPSIEYKTKKKRNRTASNRWTEDEVSFIISNLDKLPSELARLGNMDRHTEKGITLMRNKLRSGQYVGMSKEIEKFARNEMLKFHSGKTRGLSLLDPIELSHVTR